MRDQFWEQRQIRAVTEVSGGPFTLMGRGTKCKGSSTNSLKQLCRPPLDQDDTRRCENLRHVLP
jgi:hypothetical protein